MKYDFRCKDCGNTFEKEMSVTKYTATSIHFCPLCKSRNTGRVYPEIAAHFIGRGFTKSVQKGGEEL